MQFKIILFLVLLICSVGLSGATVYYDSTENCIRLDNGTNTLSSMCSDLNNVSLLDYNSSTNTYTLNRRITTVSEHAAHVVLENATLIMNSTADITVSIECQSDFNITDMDIKPMNYSYPFILTACGDTNNPYSAFVNNSIISGGKIHTDCIGYSYEPRIPTRITNNTFQNYTSSGDDGALRVYDGSAHDAILHNNTFENIHITAGDYNGIIRLRGHENMDINGLYIYNCSVNSYGMTYFFGSSDKNTTLSNIKIKNCIGNGIAGKEYGNIKITNLEITNLSGSGLHVYYTCENERAFYIENSTMDDVGTGISRNGYSDLVDLYI